MTDCSISSPSNDQNLVFTTTSSLNKWTPYTLSGATINDTTKTITVSGTTALSGLTTDVAIISPAINQVLQYNGTKWKNTDMTLYMSTVNAVSVNQNSIITTAYVDNTNSYIAMGTALAYIPPDAITYGNNVYTGYGTQIPTISDTTVSMTTWNINYFNSAYSRVNCLFSTPIKISGININIFSEQNYGTANYITFNIYGSNNITDYNYTSSSTCNGTLLFSFTPSSTGLNVYSATTAYTYIMVITTLKAGYIGSATCNFSFQIQSYSLSGVLSLGSDYTITSSSTSGAPVITYLKPLSSTFLYSMNALCVEELYRRVFPICRDANAIKLTDGTHNITMSSTSSGYSIGQCTDTNISSPSNNQILQYNGTSWVNSSNCTLTQLNFSNSGNTISLVSPTLSSSSNYFLPTTASPSAGLVLT